MTLETLQNEISQDAGEVSAVVTHTADEVKAEAAYLLSHRIADILLCGIILCSVAIGWAIGHYS